MRATEDSPVHRTVPRFIRDRRWWLVLLAGWLAIVSGYAVQLVDDIEDQTTRIALEGARNMFRMVVLTRNWNSSHGGIYVPVTGAIQPNPYLDHPLRDIETRDGMRLTMVNPAYMTRLIAEMAESDSGALFRLTSLRPIRSANSPDEWEERALIAFDNGQREQHEITHNDDGRSWLRYMAPLEVRPSCLPCHEQQGYQVGDVRGGISISQPYSPIAAVMHSHMRDSLIAVAVVFFLIAGLGWWMLNLLRDRWLELARRVKELQDTQSQLIQSEKLASIGQLAAGVAHEINNPVGFVSSNLGRLNEYSQTMIALLDNCRAGRATEQDFVKADYAYLKDDLGDLISESAGGLERVKRIVADLKDFSRIDQAAMQDTILNEGIESTLNVVWNELKYKATIVKEYGNLPPVRCIAAQINQVTLNLLINAAHAIEEQGTITIRTGHDATHVWFEIEDTGRGMSPDTMQRIFEPFFTTKPVGKGTGLGLSLAYDIVQKHQGSIDVTSTPGKGSTFRVTLPRKQADQSHD